MTLPEQILVLHAALASRSIPHAFGGALALAYCTEQPRGTKDIDVNVFVDAGQIDNLIDALPDGVIASPENLLQLERDGQSRLWWDETPVDIFLSNHSYHDHAKANLRRVPFVDIDDLPVLACADLAVFKSFFARPKDAVDVGAMVEVDAIDLDEIETTVAALLGDGEQRRSFFDRVRSDLRGVI